MKTMSRLKKFNQIKQMSSSMSNIVENDHKWEKNMFKLAFMINLNLLNINSVNYQKFLLYFEI